MSFQIIICFLVTLSTVIYGKDTRIAGGINSQLFNFPYLASLKRISDNEHVCGGAILSTRHVVTVGECVDKRFVDPDDMEIRVGVTDIVVENEYFSGYVFKIDEFFLHPEYKKVFYSNISYHNNIAVIRIRGSFQFEFSINIIELPTVPVNTGQMGTLVGWGINIYRTNDYPRKVRKATMQIKDPLTCGRQLDLRILYDQICAFNSQGVGPCTGDSGSPLVIDNKLVGLVSLFEPCATGVPDIYTNVHSHVEFINSILHL